MTFPVHTKDAPLDHNLEKPKKEKLFGVQRKVFGVYQKTFPYPVSTVILSADFLLFAREKNLPKVTFSRKKYHRRLPRAMTLEEFHQQKRFFSLLLKVFLSLCSLRGDCMKIPFFYPRTQSRLANKQQFAI